MTEPMAVKISFRVPTDIGRRLDASALANARTRSQEAKARLEESFSREIAIERLDDTKRALDRLASEMHTYQEKST